MGSFNRIARLLLFTGAAIFPIALAAQNSNGQASKPSSSTAQTIAASEQQEGLPADLPAWAYGFDNTKDAARADSPDSDARGGKDNGLPRHLPNSKFSFTLTQIRDNSGPADWYPEDHPPMPNIVAHGHKPVVACSFCHYPNGKGTSGKIRTLTGLPYSYILQVLDEFRTGAPDERGHQKSSTQIR